MNEQGEQFDQGFDQGGAHLDAFAAPELDAGGDVGDDVRPLGEDGEALDAATELIGRDAFAEVFNIAFNLPGMLSPAFAPLAIKPEEQAPARGASDAVHRLLEIYCPSALAPGGETVALIIQAGPFIVAKAMAVKAIIAEQRAARMAAMQGQAANTNGPPQTQAANTNAPPQTQAAPESAQSWMDAEQVAS